MFKFFSNFKIIFYSINFFLIFLYLFPGSLLGYFIYGNFDQQPILMQNTFGSSLNHFFVDSKFLHVSENIKSPELT